MGSEGQRGALAFSRAGGRGCRERRLRSSGRGRTLASPAFPAVARGEAHLAASSRAASTLDQPRVKEEAVSPWRREGSPKEGHPGGMVSGEGPPSPGEASQLPGQDGGTSAGADAGRWSCLEGGQ